MAVLEFISNNFLILLVFIVPGYVSLWLITLVIRTFSRTLKFRTLSDFSTLEQFVISVIISSVVFTLIFAASNIFTDLSYEDLVGKLSPQNVILFIFVTMIFALFASFGFFVALLLLKIIVTLIMFSIYVNPKKKYNFFSKKRMRAIYDSWHVYSKMSDFRYVKIVEAWKLNKKVQLVMKDGRVLTGKLVKYNGRIPDYIDQFELKNNKGVHVAFLSDVKYVCVLKGGKNTE